MFDINEAVLTATLADLREKLPIPFVMEHYNKMPHSQTGDRLHYINPFRNDEKPSLDVFVNDKGVQRWGDYATGEQGSVLDLILKFENKGHINDIINQARTLYRIYLESDWKGSEFGQQERKLLTPDEVAAILMTGDRDINNHEVTANLIESKLALTPDMLEGWNLRVINGKLAAPYPDLVGIRYRHEDGSKTFEKGSKHALYYKGEFDRTKPVLLVEGETDCYAATAYAPDMMVVALPGVGSQPTKLGELLVGCSVTIFFDGDDAGRDGAQRWETWLTSQGCEVSVVPTPDGIDICDMTQAEFQRCLTQRRPLVVNVMGMVNLGLGYGYRAQKENQEDVYLSDWTLTVKTIVLGKDGRGYEGDFCQGGKVATRGVLLDATALSSPTRLAKWARQYGGSWSGGPGTNAKLTNLLDSESSAVFMVPGTSRPGLEGSTYTFPGGHIGRMEVRTYPGDDNPLSLPDAYEMEPVDKVEAAATLRALRDSRTANHMMPILAWYAMAPLRSKYRQFPILFVAGVSGTGKTTTMEYTTKKFSGVDFTTVLTSTTPYGVSRLMGSSNAYPLYFDEYRKGGDQKAMERLDQHIRDAYTGSPSSRGGMDRDDYSKITQIHTMSPIVISGESYADEQSHRDRLIKIFMQNDSKGTQPPDYLKPLAHNYLTWLTTPRQYEPAPVDAPPVVTPYDHPGLSDRQKWNIGVIISGYYLLCDYAEYLGVTLPPLVLESILSDMVDESSEDYILEVLVQVFESQYNDDNDAVQIINGCTHIHPASVLEVCNRMKLDLPFVTGRQLAEFLKKYHKARRRVDNTRANQRRVWVIREDIRKAHNNDD